MNSEENEDLKLPEGWVLCQSKSNPGRRYFFNTKTGKSSWTQPQAEDEVEQKKQKNKKEKPSIRERRKKIETQMKVLKRKSDGADDSMLNKKLRPESTPDDETPSPANPATPLKCTEPKPIDKEPTLKPILTKNIANTRLAQLRARLSSEAQTSMSNDEIDSPSNRLKIPRTPAPFTEQKTVRFDLKSPPSNEFRYTTRSPNTESLHSTPSSSQFLAANKIISSIKAQLPDQFSNIKPRDTFADIEEGICNQTAEYPFMKHPATPPQFSEASKIVSAIKSKLSYTPVDYKDNKVRSIISNREYMDKVKNFMSSKEPRFRNDRHNYGPGQVNPAQINQKPMETRSLVPPQFMGNSGDQRSSFVPNRDQLNFKSDGPITCLPSNIPTIPNIRPTDPRQDKLRTFISNIRQLNNIENNKLRPCFPAQDHVNENKLRPGFPAQEHINYQEYKARNCLPNRTNSEQTNHVAETFRNTMLNMRINDNLRPLPGRPHVQDNLRNQMIGRQDIEDKRSQIPGRKVYDNQRMLAEKRTDDNMRVPMNNRQSIEGDVRPQIRRSIDVDYRSPLANRRSIESDVRAQTPVRRNIEDDVRIPISNKSAEGDVCSQIQRGMGANSRNPMPNRRSTESNVRTRTPVKQNLEDDIRIPISERLSLEKRKTLTPIRKISEDKPRFNPPNRKQFEEKIETQTQIRENAEECSRTCTQTIESTQEKSKLVMHNRNEEETLENHTPNTQPIERKPMEQSEEQKDNLNKESPQKIILIPADEKLEVRNTEPVAITQISNTEMTTNTSRIEERTSSIEEEIAKMDQKSPQNQNFMNHMKEEVSMELCIKPDEVKIVQEQKIENHIFEEDENEGEEEDEISEPNIEIFTTLQSPELVQKQQHEQNQENVQNQQNLQNQQYVQEQQHIQNQQYVQEQHHIHNQQYVHEQQQIQNQQYIQDKQDVQNQQHVQDLKSLDLIKETYPITPDDSVISLLSDDSNDGLPEIEKSKVEEIQTFSSAKDRMESLRNRLSKEAEVEEVTEITDVEFLNSIKLPSPNVITDEEYLNMIELPKYPSEAMDVDCKEDMESTSFSCPPHKMDPNADIVLVVDTNIFIHELDVIRNVLNSHIKGYTEQPTLLVPWRVINELDRLKDNNNGNGAICKRARAAMDYLYKSLPENNRIKGQSLRDSNSHIYPCESPDDEILNCCLQQAERGKAVILLSNDKNLCTKAAINGVRCIGLDELKPLLESKPQPAAPGLCANVKHCETNMYQLLANILENEMRAKYNNLWQHVIFKAPPWSLTDVLQCILKHWIAVFNEVFPRIEHLITDLRNTVVCIENKDPKSLTESEVATFKELCLEIAKKCQIIPEYMELAKATVERLQRKASDDVPPEMAVIEAFERLWTVFSSYCAQLCSAIGIECSLEDKLGGACTARELGERWPVYSAQLYALTLAIKGSLCLDDEELTEEQVDELEDVFKESLALVQTDGSKVNKDNLRIFCTKCGNMLQEAAAKFCGLTELLNVCKQRMETM